MLHTQHHPSFLIKITNSLFMNCFHILTQNNISLFSSLNLSTSTDHYRDDNLKQGVVDVSLTVETGHCYVSLVWTLLVSGRSRSGHWCSADTTHQRLEDTTINQL